MAFVEYMFLIKPGMKALVNLAKNLKAAKANDGKIDLSEYMEAIGNFGEEMLPAVASLIRDPENEKPSAT